MPLDYLAATRAAIARLDPHQRAASDAIRFGDGNLRVASVAGAGKTSSLVATIAAQINLDSVPPGVIMATTFTRKAAEEMKERLSHLVPVGLLRNLKVGTFHSIGRRQLAADDKTKWSMRRCVNIRSDVPRDYKIGKAVVNWAKDGVPGTEEKSLDIDGAEWNVYSLAIGRLRAKGLLPEDKESRQLCRESVLVKLLQVWAMYEASKKALGAWDFDDVLYHWFQGLKDAHGGLRPQYVYVDEAQDNSKIQLDIAVRLAERGKGRVILIGSGEQAIFSWRGASPDIFVGAEELLSATTVAIPNNYRSGKRIVAVGNRVADSIDPKWRSPVPAVAVRQSEGDVFILEADDSLHEAYQVAQMIKTELDNGGSPSDFAILVRTNSAASYFEGGLMNAHIPCVRSGGKPFFERYDVLNFLGYTILSETDSWPAFERIYNKPKRYLGRAFLKAVGEKVNEGHSIIDSVKGVAMAQKGGSRDKARDFGRFLERLRGLSYRRRLHEVTRLLVRDIDKKAAKAGAPDEDRAAIPKTCEQIALRFESGLEFAYYAEACARNSLEARELSREEEKDRVLISTIHGYKGLQAPTVIVSMPQGTFPHSKALGKEEHAEELRLCYVAVTRPEDRLVVSYPLHDMEGRPLGPSIFVDFVRTPEENPEDLTDAPATPPIHP